MILKKGNLVSQYTSVPEYGKTKMITLAWNNRRILNEKINNAFHKNILKYLTLEQFRAISAIFFNDPKNL